MSSRPALVSMSRCGHEDATTTWVLQRLVSSVLNNGGFVKLNVPPTLVFSDMGNRHHHFLQTGDDGYLRLHETCLNDHPQDGPSDWRGALDVFRELNRDCQSCVVWYAENEREVMDIALALKLAENASWREQVVALQGHIVPFATESGIYSASEDDLFGSCGNLRYGAAKFGLNMLTKALVNCVMDGDVQEHRVDFMRAVYVVDGEGVLWFSHAEDLHLRTSQKKVSVLPACWLVKSQLRRILGRAIQAGASIEEMFLHFDLLHRGYVSSYELKEGLLKFGIGVSDEVADALLKDLGGATQFTALDLASFVGHVSEASSVRRVKPYQGKRPAGSNASENGLEHERIAPSHSRNDEVGGVRMPAVATPQQQGREHGAASGRTGEEEVSSDEVDSRPRSQTPSRKFRWDELPSWARKSSKRALQELMGHHQRSMKKVRANSNPKDPAVLTNELELHVKPHRVFHDSVPTTGHGRASSPRSGQRPVSGSGANPKKTRHTPRDSANGDLKLHIGGGNVISYRWVTRTVAKPIHGGTVLEAMEALNGSQKAMGLPTTNHEPFLLVALPGLFMTLDSMERGLGGLLEHNNRGKLLLVGSLGLPGTDWAGEGVLDARVHAHGLSTLLWELMERGELCLNPAVCVVLLGFGSGANAILSFASSFLTDAKFSRLRDCTRFLVLINPFPAVPDTSSESQQIKKQLHTLKRTLERSDHHEQLQSLVAAIFSVEYIAKSGRADVLQDFWLTRQGLELPESRRPKSAPNSSKVKGRRTSTPQDEQLRVGNQSGGKGGVLKCIEGVLRGTTLGARQSAVNVPVLLITSTRDPLDSSDTAEHCRASLEAEVVDSLFKLVSGNRHRRILVCPVQAGREIMQEEPVRTLKIISSAIHAAQAQPLATRSSGAAKCIEDKSLDNDDVFDVVAGYYESSPPSTLIDNDPDSADHLEVNLSNDVEMEDDECMNRSCPPTPERARESLSPKGRRAREFDARKERAAERKAKSERLKRQQELNRLKRAKREEDEIQGQYQECRSMYEEDERSVAVDRHIRGLEMWASSVADAKERALELTSTRDQHDQKLIEDQLARDRVQQHVERNELFRQRKRDLLEQDEIEDYSLPAGGRHDEVEFARKSCQNLLEQLFSLRRRIVKTMHMEIIRREQLETFQAQYCKLEAELRASRRLQSTNARGVLGDVPVQELKDISDSVARQHALLGTYQSVLKERREIWEMAVSHIQKLKIAISTKESELRETLKEVRHTMAALRGKAGRIRAKNESMAALRASVESKTKVMKNRVKLLTREQSLLNSHDGIFFDSDIWQQGVPQRMSKATLAQNLQVELTSLDAGIKNNTQQTMKINETLTSDTLEGQGIDISMKKFAQLVNTIEDRLASTKTVAQELQDVLDAEQQLKSIDESVLTTSRQHNAAGMIRTKPSHQRSIEEKQWVALDILINKDSYKELSAVENEELQLNDEYKTQLKAEDVRRILGLPHEIQLALPHMKSAAEVDAHRLLTTYTLEHGDAEFAKADEQSQDHLFPVSFGETNLSIAFRGEGMATEEGERRVSNPVHVPTVPSPSRSEASLSELHGRSVANSPPSARTSADPLKPALAQVPSVSRDKTPFLNLVEALSDIDMKRVSENDGELAIRIGGREVYRSASGLLGNQESRVHSFAIGHLPPIFCVDLKVVINFSGCIDSRGFNRGRISAALRRKSTREGELEGSAGGCAVGYAPHARQKLNLGDQFYQTPGTIMIQHCPRRVPLACGTYEVEVTALGPTEYDMVVVAGQCELCASLVGKRLEEARNLKARLKDLEREQGDTWEGVRLRERQYHVCNTLIKEADSECIRCQEAIDELCEYLRPRRDAGVIVGSFPEASSSMSSSGESGTRSTSTAPGSASTRATTSSTNISELSETERAQTWDEVAAIETEHMHWGRLLTTRCQEKASVKAALDEMMKLRRDGRAEKARLEGKLVQISAEIPIVVEVLEGPSAAAEVSRELSSIARIGRNGCRSSGGEGDRNSTISLETPAGRTRHAFERHGWEALTLEEQQWVTLDQEQCPEKYEWLQQQQREDIEGVGGGTKPCENPGVDQYRVHRDELARILAESTGNLSRKDMHIWKLLHKFHDDPQLVSLDGTTACSETHDVPLAERTRLKNSCIRTATEKEWISLDKVLNPTIWKRAKGGVPGSRNDQRPSEEDDINIPSQTQVWTCPFNRDDLLRIWAQNDATSLTTDDEKRAFKLLTSYNGTCPRGTSNSTNRGWKGVQMGKSPKGPDTDIDRRLRRLQRELDMVTHTRNPTMISSILHGAPQRYPTSTLRLSLEAEMDRLLREQVQQRERKNAYLIEDYSSSEEDEESYMQGKKREARRTRRLSRRMGRGTMNIFDARKRVLLESKRTPLEKENARQIANLGPGGCPACMSNPCKRTPVVNVEETISRMERIADELHFARSSTEKMVESTLPISVQWDGVTSFRRVDFIHELSLEQKHLRLMLKLHHIDDEFHEANRTSSDHMESVALHGYRTFLWTKDARVALEREHSRLVARAVAVEITHDILEWMLEGWHFGERPCRHATQRHVPSVQANVPTKTGADDEGRHEAPAGDARTVREQEEDRASTFTLPPGVDGSSWNTISERVVKEGGVHDQEIGFMERTMRFGLFCVAVMYFRARWLLRQQRERASEFKLGWKIDTSVPVRAQRKPISQTTVSSTQPGYQRVKVRKEKEQAEVLADFAGFVAVEKREIDASQLIQRVLRGHIGRKAAHRWREKRAEYNATNSLMVSAAVSIQRFLRGSWGRSRARTIRAGIARWLAHLIDDEAREFEAEILSTNKLEAVKRGIEELMDDDSDVGG